MVAAFMDNNGNLNCQRGAGPYEKFLFEKVDSAYTIRSNQFQDYYLNLNPQGIVSATGAGWDKLFGKKYLNADSYFAIVTPTPAQSNPNRGLNISNLALHYQTPTPSANYVFRAAFTVTNNTGAAFPSSGGISSVSLDVYAATNSNTDPANNTFTRIGEVSVDLGSLAANAATTVKPSAWDSSGFTSIMYNKLAENPSGFTSGSYFIYIQVRNNDNSIDSTGEVSASKYKLPPG